MMDKLEVYSRRRVVERIAELSARGDAELGCER